MSFSTRWLPSMTIFEIVCAWACGVQVLGSTAGANNVNKSVKSPTKKILLCIHPANLHIANRPKSSVPPKGLFNDFAPHCKQKFNYLLSTCYHCENSCQIIAKTERHEHDDKR